MGIVLRRDGFGWELEMYGRFVQPVNLASLLELQRLVSGFVASQQRRPLLETSVPDSQHQTERHPDSPINVVLIVNQIGKRRFGERIELFMRFAALA